MIAWSQVVATTHVGQCVARGDTATERAARRDRVGVAQQERLSAEAHQVGSAIISAGLRQAGGIPVQEILGTNGQFGVDGEGHRNLVTWHEQFLSLGTGRRRQLGQVQAGLAVADRVHRIEQGLAPEHVVLTSLDAEQGLLADFGAVEHEGIENFTRRPVVIALGIVAQVRAAITNVVVGDTGQAWVVENQPRGIAIAVDERVGIRAGILIGLVIPTGGADAKTHVLFVNNVHLGQQVDPVGDVGARLAKVVIAVVVVRRAEHALVGAFGTYAVVVLDGVVQAY
ncbi:hypothetical protein D3C84_594840 [compost metagenome]